MNADAEIGRQKSFTLPEDAVLTWEDKQYVFEETQPKTYTMTEVKIGSTENGYIEILEINPAFLRKKIVTKGAYQLLMALKNVEE
jgi:cobalt-zinc-cadmium efflux system membrane fusion protein